ncbi:MAG: TolC family protein [Planctomycetota bacterium]
MHRLLFIAVPLVAGCTLHEVTPDPMPPATMPAAFPSESAPAVEDAWWLEFGDDQLDGLIAQALEQNLSARDFAARLVAARARTRQAGAVRRPLVDGVGSAGWTFGGDGGLDSETFDNAEFGSSVGVAASWELDLFGRLRSAQDAAVADASAAANDLEAVRLAVAADVATAYFRSTEQRLLLELLDDQLERDRTLLELIELRFAVGNATSADLLRQRAQVSDVAALVPPAQAELRRAENALDALLGRAADGGDVAGDRLADFPTVAAVGVPSDLLTRRPDLRAAQDRLLAADYRIGVAVADRLPRVTLVGTLGYADNAMGSGVAGSLLGDLVAPLVDWGLREAVVVEREAEYASLLAAYGDAFVTAVAEVDSLLFAERRQRERVDALADRVDALESAVAEIRARYAGGQGDYLDVLTALEDLQDTQRELLAERRNLVQLRIDLHRAAGGGLGTALPTEPLDPTATTSNSTNAS